MLVLEDVGLLTRKAAVVHRKAGALDVGAWRITVAAHAVQGWGWPDTSCHLFCDNQVVYFCDFAIETAEIEVRHTSRGYMGKCQSDVESDEVLTLKMRPAVGPSYGLFVERSADPIDNPARPQWPLPTV